MKRFPFCGTGDIQFEACVHSAVVHQKTGKHVLYLKPPGKMITGYQL